jgi:hypothetical protein
MIVEAAKPQPRSQAEVGVEHEWPVLYDRPSPGYVFGVDLAMAIVERINRR